MVVVVLLFSVIKYHKPFRFDWQCNCLQKSVCKPVSFSRCHAQNLECDTFVPNTFQQSNCIHFKWEYIPPAAAMLVPCPIHCTPKLTRGCQESIPGMKNDVIFSCCGHINHTTTISSSLDTNLDFSLLPLPFSLHSYITVFPLLLHCSLSLPLFLSASSADAPCHSSYFSLLKFPNWSQLEPLQSKGGLWGGGR